MNSRTFLRLLPLAAMAAVVVGGFLLLRSESRPATFGWFAYAPLAEGTGTWEGLHVISTGGLVGTAVLVLGLVVLAFWCGLRLGARRPRTP
ncbi:hypothetical protein [Arthrobacter sp.]|uniref:hypothetical protein n=1 Tax=Arthrobacter sp. TaxID=1667 RepID=UPI003A918DA4